eukprot:Selendium_serpulae@DN456_c0_g1_i1.p1
MKKRQDAAMLASKKTPLWRLIENIWAKVPSLNSVSTFATFICIIDCTLYPIFLAVVSIFDLVDSKDLAWIHDLTHWCTNFIVIPIGLFAVCSNFLQLKMPRYFFWGLGGLLLIAGAHDLGHAAVPGAQFIHDHHTLISIIGGGNLIASNVMSKRVMAASGIKCCGHKHDHYHAHADKV